MGGGRGFYRQHTAMPSGAEALFLIENAGSSTNSPPQTLDEAPRTQAMRPQSEEVGQSSAELCAESPQCQRPSFRDDFFEVLPANPSLRSRTDFMDGSENRLSFRTFVLSSVVSTFLADPLLKCVQRIGRGCCGTGASG
jgi:hypothetical protein